MFIYCFPLYGVMFLYLYMFVCLCLFVFAACREDEYDPFSSFEESTIKHGDQVIELFVFYEIEDPEHLFGEGKCPLTYYVPFTS
jgi:hypothetical protein